MTHIAVIGAGFSGTVLSCHLLSRGSSFTVHLIEQSGSFGPGVAYGTEDGSHILNVPAGDMSAFPDEPDHFVRWLSERRPDTAPTDFVERLWYGRYLSELLAECSQKLRRYSEAAVDSKINDDGTVELTLASGQTLNCDYVVLAVGNLPPVTRPRHIRHFWKSPVWQSLDPQARILIVGTGLSMVDAVLTCEKNAHAGAIHAVSRRGLLPRVHTPAPAFLGNLPSPPYTVRQLTRWIRTESRKTGWASVMNYLRPRITELWDNLSLKEKQRFTRHASSYWDVHRHRMPASSSQTLHKMRSEQRLDIMAGKVLHIEEQGEGLRVVLKKRGGGTMQLDVDYLLDCSGNERCIRKLPSPVVQSLLAHGLIIPDHLDMGISAGEDGRCHTRDSTNGPIFAIGAILKGTLWETSAVRELRIQCQNVAQTLLDLIDEEYTYTRPDFKALEANQASLS